MARSHDDMEQFTRDADNPTHPEPVRARLRVVAKTAETNLAAINSRLMPRVGRINRDANALMQSKKSTTEKIYAVWAIADEFYADTGRNVACKRGCNHCCHIAVAMMPEEAEAVGKRIGRTPRNDVRMVENPSVGFPFGYNNPCTFLKNGECSIYANRPLACRIHYSLDIDSLLCELRPPKSSPVPYLNPLVLNTLLLQVIEPRAEKCLADIREYFPRRENR